MGVCVGGGGGGGCSAMLVTMAIFTARTREAGFPRGVENLENESGHGNVLETSWKIEKNGHGKFRIPM